MLSRTLRPILSVRPSNIRSITGFGYVNKVQLVGNVGKDPEVFHYAQSNQSAQSTGSSSEDEKGRKYVRFSVATTEYIPTTPPSSQSSSNPSPPSSSSSGGEKRTQWHRIVVFTPSTVDFIERHLKSGAKVYVEGKLSHRQVPLHPSPSGAKDVSGGKDGETKIVSEVVVGGYQGGDVVILSPSSSQSGSSQSASSGSLSGYSR